jgi:hypothetical protein
MVQRRHGTILGGDSSLHCHRYLGTTFCSAVTESVMWACVSLINKSETKRGPGIILETEPSQPGGRERAISACDSGVVSRWRRRRRFDSVDRLAGCPGRPGRFSRSLASCRVWLTAWWPATPPIGPRDSRSRSRRDRSDDDDDSLSVSLPHRQA